jgi:hypothetical protein
MRKSIDEVIAHRLVAEWLRRQPAADGEMRIAQHEHFRFPARLFPPAKLRQTRREDAP